MKIRELPERISKATMYSLRRQSHQILQFAERLDDLTVEEIKSRAARCGISIRAGKKDWTLIRELFGLVITSSRRVLGMTHFPVQIEAGLALLQKRVIEMQTGEGKTLTILLPATFQAMHRRGCHIVTANDYLAARDAEMMKPVFGMLGLSVGCIQSDFGDAERAASYSMDVTYGNANQFGFDFLRDEIKRGAERTNAPNFKSFRNSQSATNTVQRPLHTAIVDEADHVLLDEATTPLVIGTHKQHTDRDVARTTWANTLAQESLVDEDFIPNRQSRSVTLTNKGCRKVALAGKDAYVQSESLEKLYQAVERGITAKLFYSLDRDYVIEDDEIVIVDEGTGRALEGRKWQKGLHQAVEAKEVVTGTGETATAASITIQSFFKRYEFSSGITGTVSPCTREFKSTYGMKFRAIPPNRPCRRRTLVTRVFTSRAAKWSAVAADTKRRRHEGRPVLIGTPSVNASEELSAVLTAIGIPHAVLNAKSNAEEAQVISNAGTSGTVTVATNMAGRGTDIPLDDASLQAGGLHVIATEVHSSRRFDRQLAGRCARQGDPGTHQLFVSLDDELLQKHSAEFQSSPKIKGLRSGDVELPLRWLRVFARAQRNAETLSKKSRRDVTKRDDSRSKRCRELGINQFLEFLKE